MAKTIFQTQLTASDTVARDNLGDIREQDGKRYKYVKFLAAAVAGDVQKYANLAGYNASEVRPSTTAAEVVAGVALTTHAANAFGWIQIGGKSPNLAVNISGSPAMGSGVTSSTTTKALAAHTGELQEAGVVLDLTSGANVVLLQCPD